MKRLVAAGLFAALLAEHSPRRPRWPPAPRSPPRDQFGKMLWDPNRQAVYIFQRDKRGKSRCYGECAEACRPSIRAASRWRAGVS